MKKITWYINRLKAMNPLEILWRLQQKRLQQSEKATLYKSRQPVFKAALQKRLSLLTPHAERIYINEDNQSFSLFWEQSLFEKFPYSEFETRWNAGFQTDQNWPYDACSYDIQISQREDIGDIRTNWELSRHYQFCGLSKNYYLTGDSAYLEKLSELFYDWNDKNRFLCGVEWTSAMEIAIRVNSWIYTYCFLSLAFKKHGTQDRQLLSDLSHGILIMTDYILKHRARYSSANNHLIVEMYAVATAGIFYDYEPFFKTAFRILTEELNRQNTSDGVNREMSLHYQSFVMEAYGLLLLNCRHNGLKFPEASLKMLSKMSEFLCDCCGNFGETVVFGDNDEGKILDLSGKAFDHYRYVLELMSLLLDRRYLDLDNLNENLCWLFGSKDLTKAKNKPLYESAPVRCYREGGYTLLRSKSRIILIGIDHADLGFGSLAAHGHADALSFQMFVNGKPVFCDPGTYNYHISKKLRDDLRKTQNHNTVCIDNKDQSQILGAFLWGRKAQCRLTELKDGEQGVKLSAKQNGYAPIAVARRFHFNRENELSVTDIIKGTADGFGTFVFSPDCTLKITGKNTAEAESASSKICIEFCGNIELSVTAVPYSESYCSLKETTALRYAFTAEDAAEITAKITVFDTFSER